MIWQPIETVPKDGTEILVCMFGNTTMASMAVVYYDCEETSDYPWKTMDGPGYHKDAPTHWMPLPEFPSALKNRLIDPNLIYPGKDDTNVFPEE